MKKIKVYSKDYCPYCKAAKALLNGRGLDFEEIDVARDQEKLSEMLSLSQRRTVPQIFWGNEHIGGYTDLVAYVQSNPEFGKAA